MTFTVNVGEEYFYLGVVMGAPPKSQALVHQNGHDYDKMTVTDGEGQERDVWFNTGTDMQKMAAAIEDANKK